MEHEGQLAFDFEEFERDCGGTMAVWSSGDGLFLMLRTMTISPRESLA